MFLLTIGERNVTWLTLLSNLIHSFEIFFSVRFDAHIKIDLFADC